MVEKREKQNTHQHVSKNQENASEKKRAKSGVLYEATMTGITVKYWDFGLHLRFFITSELM